MTLAVAVAIYVGESVDQYRRFRGLSSYSDTMLLQLSRRLIETARISTKIQFPSATMEKYSAHGLQLEHEE